MRAAGSVESDLPDLRDDSSNSSVNGEFENDYDDSDYIGSENSDEDYGDDDGSFFYDEKESCFNLEFLNYKGVDYLLNTKQLLRSKLSNSSFGLVKRCLITFAPFSLGTALWI